MPPRKRAGSKRGASASVEPESSQVVPELPPSPQTGKIPPQARFPALVLLSLLISYTLNTVASPFTSGDLASISAHRDTIYEVAFFLSWRAVELGVGWYNGFDSKLSLLTAASYT